MTNIQIIQMTPQELQKLLDKTAKNTAELVMSKINDILHEKEYLSRKEAADLLGVTPMTISNRVKDGLLTPYRSGGVTRYKKSEVLGLVG